MVEQMSAEQVAELYAAEQYEEIEVARQGGRLASVLGVGAEEIALLDRATSGRIGNADVSSLFRMRRHDLIEHARVEGRIDHG